MLPVLPEISPDDCALLIIDMQNDFVSERGYFGRRGVDMAPFQRVVPRVRTVADWAGRRRVPRIYTEQIYDSRGLDSPEKLHRILPANFRNRQGGPRPEGACAEGSWGARIIEALAPGVEDHVIPKRRFSAFYRTELEDLLGRLERRVLLFTGLTTEICVESTAREAFFRDYDVIVFEDCTAAWTQTAHKASLEVIDFAFGLVVDSGNFLARF